MYYYALIDSTTFVCYEFYESETPITDDPYCIPVEYPDKSYILRKKYVDGVWIDTVPSEAQNMEARYIGIGEEWLDDKIYALEDAVENHTHDGYVSSDDLQLLEDVINTKASTDHVHDGYVSQTDFDALATNVNEKANVNHSHGEYSPIVHEHNNYANINHTHDDYATATSVNNLKTEINGKADVDHEHDNYVIKTDFDTLAEDVNDKADANHIHTNYALSSHEHDNYSNINHNHDERYSLIAHVHDNYITTDEFDALKVEVDGKADTSHTHDYASSTHTHTVSEIGAASSNHNHNSDYSDINHNHDGVYSKIGHDHDEDYAMLNHAHSDYATVTSLNEVSAIASGKANASHSHNDTYYTETEVDTMLSGKANTSHTHNDIYYTESEIDTKLADKSDVSHNHDEDYDIIGSASSALTSAKNYTDAEVAELTSVVSGKANTIDLTSHTNNTTIHVTSTNKSNWDAAKTHADSAHAPVNAEPNQNAFSNVVIGNTTISADQKTDTLTLIAGNNVTLTPDATGDSITISSANTVYTHPTTAGNKHIPVGGSSGQILRWSADGTAVWGNDNNTTYSEATQTVSGLMSGDDKVKLDGIADGANKYVLPYAGSSLGGVKTGGDVTISSGVITVNDDSHNHIISNIDGLQTILDGKASSGHNHDSVYYTQTQTDTLLSNKSDVGHTHTIANVTGLQSALDGKASTSHGTHVSYSTTAPVMDGTASVGTASTIARSDHKHPTDTTRASQVDLDALETVVSGKANTNDLTSHTGSKSNPHGVTLAQLGLTATASELNTLDGITATVTELNYMDGVTSNVQTQLNAKASNSHTHNYAGSSSSGGAATSANKLNTDAGDANTPVYFTNGVPVACTSLDLNTSGNAATATNVTWSGVTSKPSYYDAKAIKSITRSGTTFTYTCMDGTTGTFTQQDNNTTYNVATTSANGLMSNSDKSKLDGMVIATVAEVETYLAI